MSDVRETARFYQSRLGFTIDIVWEKPNYAVVSRDNAVIEFGEGRPDYVGSGVCYIHVTDVNTIHQEFTLADLEFVGNIGDRDYGSRDFRIKDNNGNLLIFGSPLPAKEEMIRVRNIATQI